MEILYNPYFDEPVYLDDNDPANEAWFNKTIAGTSRLLSLFEMFLGFTGKMIPGYKRQRLYRAALTEVLENKPFFLKSFKADPARTAKSLLLWRDELIVGGLDLINASGLPLRLQDLQKVERQFILLGNEYIGEADRWERVLRAINEKIEMPAISIKIMYPEELLTGWQRKLIQTITQHPSVQTSWHMVEYPGSVENNDLGKIKNYLLQESNEKIKLAADSSVAIIHTSDPYEAGHFLARYFEKGTLNQTVLLTNKSTSLPAALLSENGIASPQVISQPSEDSLLQLLKLLPACVYGPLDVRKFLELLMFPNLPFNRGLARRLARLMNNKPGRMSADWTVEKNEWAHYQKEKGRTDEEIKRDLVKTSLYLEEKLLIESNPTDASNIRDRLCNLLNNISAWANRKRHTLKEEFDSTVFTRLKEVSYELEQSIQELPAGITVSKLIYDQLLGEVLYTSALQLKPSDAGSSGVAGNGSNILSEPSEVVYMDGSKIDSAGRLIWLPEELGYFKNHGIIYNDPEEIYRQIFYNDSECVLRCRNKLLLMVPETIDGEGSEKGNLYTRIKAICSNLHEIEYHFPVDKQKMVNLFGIQTSQPAPINLPSGGKAYWKIERKDLIKMRDAESYTSIQDLIYFPYAWVLNYMAKIKSSFTISMANEFALKGTLAHRIVEKVLEKESDPINMRSEDVRDKIEKVFDELMEKEGAIFLLPEKLKELSHFKYLLIMAIPKFLKNCRDNGWKIEGFEKDLSRKLGNFPITGRVDVLLQRQSQRAVVDIKFFQAKHYMDNMGKDRDLQLIIYAGLAKNGAAFPESAYFFLTTAAFLAKNNLCFKDAIISGKRGMEAATAHIGIWNSLGETASFRWKEMTEDGMVEVGEEMDISSMNIFSDENNSLIRPPAESKCKLPRKYNDYINLLKVT